MKYERMLDKETRPSENDMLEYIGDGAALWTQIHEYMARHYDFEREKKFYAKKYGWTEIPINDRLKKVSQKDFVIIKTPKGEAVADLVFYPTFAGWTFRY